MQQSHIWGSQLHTPAAEGSTEPQEALRSVDSYNPTPRDAPDLPTLAAHYRCVSAQLPQGLNLGVPATWYVAGVSGGTLEDRSPRSCQGTA
ncbi:hypothetical protein NDU88_003978 [Pleurodeles waltl]|uniref:Uncharacterized protein n=1 Tax=Pleurodeles waltl TaxID=8319 RepID=A0AAV7PBK2_PLEWA|nr:hypothetical protein NDU88_003978 [Pleurodeles waltl]